MAEVMRGFSRTAPQPGRSTETSLTNAPNPASRTLLEVIRDLDGASTETAHISNFVEVTQASGGGEKRRARASI